MPRVLQQRQGTGGELVRLRAGVVLGVVAAQQERRPEQTLLSGVGRPRLHFLRRGVPLVARVLDLGRVEATPGDQRSHVGWRKQRLAVLRAKALEANGL